MYPISSNQFSTDLQLLDVLAFLRTEHVETYCDIMREFPAQIVMDGAWMDYEAMGVDAEYSSWMIDAAEATGRVQWIEGEPYAIEDADNADDAGDGDI